MNYMTVSTVRWLDSGIKHIKPLISLKTLWWVLAILMAILIAKKPGILLFIGFFVFIYYAGFAPRSPQKTGPDVFAKNASAAIALSVQDGIYAGDVGGQSIRIGIEDRGCVIGPPDSGKTTFLVSQLLDWAESGRSFVVNDVKPEVYELVRERLEALGYRLWVINPSHPVHHYNPLDDLNTPEAVGELAAALCPNPDRTDAVFDVSARELLDAIISHLRATQGAASLPAVRAYLASFSAHQLLIDDLSQSPSHDVRASAQSLRYAAANERLIGSILGVLMANLAFLRYPAVRDSLATSDFTLDVLHQPRNGVFLQFEESARLSTATLWSVMLAHLLRYLIVHTDREPVLVLLDQIGAAPHVPGLVEKLNMIRARKMPTWLYWQSLEQMQAYGSQGADGKNLILGACDMQMVFRLNDNESARWMSERIGTVDKVLRSVEKGFGLLDHSTVSTVVTEAAVRPHELQRLGHSKVVAAYRHLVWRGQATPYYQRLAHGQPAQV